MSNPTYILTAEMDDESFAWLDDLRGRHFPREWNFLSAHLTMFHRLAPPQIHRLAEIVLPREPIALRFDLVSFLGAGVAIRVRSPALKQLRAEIRNIIGDDLSRQDSQTWTPHVTVQNKVATDVARRLQRNLEDGFVERSGTATGLLVWEYLGGPWKPLKRIAFRDT